ncbi:hypothetical protein ACJX0J_033291 [Zea mays]
MHILLGAFLLSFMYKKLGSNNVIYILALSFVDFFANLDKRKKHANVSVNHKGQEVQLLVDNLRFHYDEALQQATIPLELTAQHLFIRSQLIKFGERYSSSWMGIKLEVAMGVAGTDLWLMQQLFFAAAMLRKRGTKTAQESFLSMDPFYSLYSLLACIFLSVKEE